MEESSFLGRRSRVAMRLLGALLLVAGLLFSLFWFVTVGVGLAEPGHLTGIQSLLVICWAGFGPLLILTGIVSLRCGTRKRLWVVGALAAAAAATVALAFILLPLAD